MISDKFHRTACSEGRKKTHTRVFEVRYFGLCCCCTILYFKITFAYTKVYNSKGVMMGLFCFFALQSLIYGPNQWPSKTKPWRKINIKYTKIIVVKWCACFWLRRMHT